MRRMRGGSARDIEKWRQALSHLENSLPAVVREIESRYSKSAQILEDLSNGSQRLVAESEELLLLATGQLDGDVVTGTAGMLAAPLEYLEGWRREVGSGLSALTSCRDVLDRLQGFESALRTLVAPLNYMQVMFRVESARLTEDVRQIFSALTEQIAVVHNEVRDTFGRQFQIVGNTVHTLDQVTKAIELQAQQLELDLQRRKDQIAASLGSINCELQKNGQRDVQLSGISRAVASDIGNIVVALQAHDIVSQRLEHVRACIGEVRELDGRKKDTDGAHPLETAFYAMTVQRSQLAGVLAQLRRSEETLNTALDSIKDKVSALDSDCMLLREFKDLTIAANGSIQTALEARMEVKALLEAVVKCSREFHEAIEPVGQLTTKLTVALESLSNRMRLIALNAQVQAVQIGAGTGLEVLAAHIAEVSSQTSSLAESISRDIGWLVTTVKALVESFQEIGGRGSRHLSDLESVAGGHETQLHGIRDRTLAKLQSVGDAAEHLARCIAELAEQSDVRQAALHPLEAAVEELTRDLNLMNGLVSRVDRNLSPHSGSARYSMESERKAHEGALKSLRSALDGESPAAPFALQSEEQPEAEGNVELF